MKTKHVISAILACFVAICSTSVLAQKSSNPIFAASTSIPFELSLLSMKIGAENTINIGSISGGGGAGKATFKELTFTKLPDAATAELLRLLTTGDSVANLFITQGNARWELGLVMVSDYSSEGVAGRDGAQIESWVLQFGSMRAIVDGVEWCWNRIENESCN
ncbi:MAG: type VI secretion system tube protein Hcp [Wenzhouxiangellaceae bacterium]|nr:type VI secretion system tube protein Hcp [Wenzhouxiangellaceae bacterium]